jgi:putative transposase
VNHNRVRRLYSEECLNLRIKRPHRHVSAAHRAERTQATTANEVWAMESDASTAGACVR